MTIRERSQNVGCRHVGALEGWPTVHRLDCSFSAFSVFLWLSTCRLITWFEIRMLKPVLFDKCAMASYP